MAAYRNRLEANPIPVSAYQKENTMTDKIEIEVPIQLLDAAQYCAAKDDTRFYLNGVAISKGHIVSTDGHRAFACKVDTIPEDLKDIIIPIDTVKHFLKKVPTKQRKQKCLIIYDRQTFNGEMQAANIRELFLGIDAKYVEWQRVIPNKHINYSGVMPQFQWAYLVDMQKVQRALGGNGLELEVCPTDYNAVASIKFIKTDFDHAIGCVMPIRI